MSTCHWKNGTYRLAQCRAATELQFIKSAMLQSTMKWSKIKWGLPVIMTAHMFFARHSAKCCISIISFSPLQNLSIRYSYYFHYASELVRPKMIKWFISQSLSWRGGHGNPLQCFCLQNPHGQRRLGGYSPWGHKESDMTEWLITHTHTHTHTHSWKRMEEILKSGSVWH